MQEKLIEVLESNQTETIMIYEEKREKTALRSSLVSLFVVYDFDVEALESDLKIDTFLVIDQMIAHQAEFGRMMDYCARTGAKIYDAKGRDLYRICKEAQEKKYYSYEELLSEIKAHEKISFDVFDTLLMRKVMLPEDVFELVQRNKEKQGILIENFKEKRLKAQELLGLSNPDIDQIYECLQNTYQILPEIVQAYKEEEIAVEKSVLIPREEMLGIYLECMKAGKQVFLVTDMYLPKEVLEEILERNGICGYSDLYLSCERKQLKLQGLLESYQSEQGTSSFLHIGDHLIHDGICAGLAGMDYALIPSAYKAALLTSLAEGMKAAESLEEHILIGLIIARLFGNPFKHEQMLWGIRICSEKEYAYAFMAAYVIKFALWIYEQAKNNQYAGILFAARDGYLMKQMYDLLIEKFGTEEMPESIYFYTSRKAAVMPCVKDEQYINMIMDVYADYDKEEILREGFCLAEEAVTAYKQEEYDFWQLYIWKHLEAIQQRAEEAKRNYMRYMGNLRLAIGWKYAFMDLVSSGTCQKSMVQYAPFEIEGLYAGKLGEADEDTISVKAMVQDKDTYFFRNYKKFESFLTSFEPSLNYFDEDGNPVFSEELRIAKEIQYIEKMQAGCIDLFRQFTDLAGCAESDTISLKWADTLLKVSESAKLDDNDSILHELSIVDDWGNQRNKI